MKVNAGTNTNFEIQEYKYKKKLSLKPLYLPLYRKNLLFEKVMMLSHNLNNLNNKDNKIDFSNKSYFIYPLKKKNILNSAKKKSNYFQSILVAKLRLKNKSNTSIKRSLSMNDSINDNNRNINNSNNSAILSLKSISSFKNPKLNELYPKTTQKLIPHPYSAYKNDNNFSGIKKKLIFDSEKKKSQGNLKSKIKSINLFNKKHNNIISGKKRKHYILKKRNNK